jgi:DNA-binding NtrC family response regulator
MAGIEPLHAPPTARLYIQRNLPSQGKRIEIAMSGAFLFPGQGSQVPGMLRSLPDHPSIARTLNEVSEALGENVLKLDSPGGSSINGFGPTGVAGLRCRCGTRSRRRRCRAGSGSRHVGGSLCRRGGSWRSQPCRWSSPDEANRTPTTGELFNSVPVGFLASRSGRHRAEECPAYIREWIPAETEEKPLRIMRGTTMAWENAVLSENEDDIETCLTGRKGVNGGFEYIVGASRALREVLDLVRTVAPTDSTALIEGETGTGKELIARAIHEHSTRRDRPFVKLNCAAIPLGLLESELFGHERGAFTGAVGRKVGRFEAADRGTVFLDEIGDIPLELQPKLLHVLQEGEFERLGSTQTQRVNVRLVAATNKDLAKLVAQNQFRSDLYYRLNIFPILVPPLRDRRRDIPSLVRHFVGIYAERMNKQIERIPKDVMEALVDHSWPGNIRELQNFIERSVILADGNTLRPPLEGLRQAAGIESLEPITMEEAERVHIRKTLEQANWVIDGPRGAAVRLGMKRSTVYFRMRKLGIFRG